MQAKELMIGDYISVKPSGMLIKVAAVHHKKVAYHAVVNKLAWVRESLLEPIPLTPEILEKNGFETEDDVHFSIQGQSDILELLLVELPFDGYYFDIVRTEKTINKCNQRCYIDRYFASIYYVHQLQHALRLCGIEKEIEL